jgi:hypothetical protein
METRLTRRPGEPGTKNLLARFGERLLRVHYLYDPAAGRRLKTVELVVESVPWTPRARAPRRRDEDIVAVRIFYRETELRERAKRLGGVWRAGTEGLGSHVGGRTPSGNHRPNC